MDLTQLANLGEFIGGVAVLATLIYLAVQVRQTSRAVEANSHTNLMQYMGSVDALTVTDPVLATLEHTGANDPDSLSEIDWKRFSHLALMRFAYWEAAFLNKESRMINPEMWEAWDAAARMIFEGEGYRRFWSEAGYAHAPSFRRYVDREVIGS